MPAETFMHSTTQINQNCGVLCASSRWTLPMVIMRLAAARRRPALRTPAGRRDAVAERADHHEHEIDDAHHQEGLPDADRGRGLEVIHQHIGERRADHRAAAEAHDRHAGRHAAAVGKPFDQRRDRRNVAEPEADAADHAGAEPEQPELVDGDAEAPRSGSRRPSTAPRRRRPCAARRAPASRRTAPPTRRARRCRA